MALALIAEPPEDPGEMSVWAMAHAMHHYDCIRAATAKLSQQFDQWPLEPFDPEQLDFWLDQHQEMHEQMDKVLKIAAYDLSGLDFKEPSTVDDWFMQNYAEHQQWSNLLGVG